MHLPRQQMKRLEASEINNQLNDIKDDMDDDIRLIEEMFLDEVDDFYLACVINLHFL